MVRYGTVGDRGVAANLPSSMFLMRTLRSATSLSTVNCSLSDVVRRTIVLQGWWGVAEEMRKEKKGLGERASKTGRFKAA